MKKTLAIILALALVFSSFTVAFAEEVLPADATAVKGLGMLVGAGTEGVTLNYLKTAPTRIQAAIMVLRLKGLEDDAKAFTGTDNFADADDAKWAAPIMAYLKANPTVGFAGTGGANFEPNKEIDARSYYKVMLETLGYKQNTAEVIGDFTFAKTIEFAATKGLTKIASVLSFTVNDVAVATMEALKAFVAGSTTKTLGYSLVEAKIITAEAAIAAGIYTAPVVALAVESATATNLKEIVIKFNKELDSTKVTAANFTVGGVAAAAAPTLSTDKKTVTVVPATILANKADYAVKILKAVGLAADYSVTVRAFDTAIPVVSSMTLTGPNTIDLLFTEPIMTAGTVKVNNGIYGVTVGAVGTNKVTVTLSASSLPAAVYEVKIEGFKDYAGFSIDATTLQLTYAKDATLPVATIKSATQSTVVVTFNKAVTLDATNAYVDYFYHTFSAWAPNTVVKSADSKTYTLTFTTFPIPAGTANLVVKYKAAATGSDIVDAWGNKLVSNITLPVTVAADVTAPAVTAVEVTDEQTVVVKFSESLSVTAAEAIAETLTNYVVKDSAGKAVTTLTSAVYTETVADGLYKVTLGFSSKLTGGNYTVEVKNIADGALTSNVMPTVTLTFAITDLTPINFATAGDVVVTAIESTTANVEDVIYVTFAEKMAVTGQYSVLDAKNYLLNGAVLPTGTTLTAFGTTGKVVKIAVPENATYNKQTVVNVNLTIARVADLAGNTTVALSGVENVGTVVAPIVVASTVKQTDSNKVTVTIDAPLSVVLASGFKTASAEVASIDSWSINSDNQTVINVTVNAIDASVATTTNTVISSFEVVANILVAETGMKMAANTGITVLDYRAPKLVATTPIVATADTITLTFTENLYDAAGAEALYAHDLVITDAEGKVLVAAVDYHTTVVNNQLIVHITATNAKFTIKSVGTINYIKDASVQMNKAAAFTTAVEVLVP